MKKREIVTYCTYYAPSHVRKFHKKYWNIACPCRKSTGSVCGKVNCTKHYMGNDDIQTPIANKPETFVDRIAFYSRTENKIRGFQECKRMGNHSYMGFGCTSCTRCEFPMPSREDPIDEMERNYIADLNQQYHPYTQMSVGSLDSMIEESDLSEIFPPGVKNIILQLV